LAYDYRDIILDKHERLQVQRQQTLLELEIARQREDADGTRYAADQIIAIDGDIDRLNRVANAYVNQQQPSAYGFDNDTPRKHVELAQRHGVSPDRIGIALNWTTDPTMTDDEKVKTYMENTRRYEHDRATGRYRDDQGTVKR
jgi:hypothetical protein